jgi:hypothetical protein
MFKRIALILVVLIVLAAAGGTAWWLVRGASHGLATSVGVVGSMVERWAGDQLLRVANDLLRPEVTVESFTYQPPLTVTLRGVRVTDRDVDVITADVLRVQLTRIPRQGTAVVIESAYVEGGTLRLIPDGSGGLLALSNMIASKTGQTYDDGGSSRPSDVFAIRHIEIIDGTVTHEVPGRRPMILDQFEFVTECDAEAEPGLYRIDAKIARDALGKHTLEGVLDLDQAALQIDKSHFEIDINAEEYRAFPASFQEFLESSQIVGQLTVDIDGYLPFGGGSGRNLTFRGDVRNARIVLGKSYQLPITNLSQTIRLTDDRLALERFDLEAFRGKASIQGEMRLDEDLATQVQVHTEGLRIEDMLLPGENGQAAFAGACDIDGSLAGRLKALPGSLRGSGHVHVTEGRFWNDPVIGGLMHELKLEPAQTPEQANTDKGQCDLQVLGDQIEFRNVDVISGAMGVRGAAELTYGLHLNARVNAGPMERVQREMGDVGAFFGSITDAFVKYQIVGPWSDPTFEIRPFGIGAEPTKSASEGS